MREGPCSTRTSTEMRGKLPWHTEILGLLSQGTSSVHILREPLLTMNTRVTDNIFESLKKKKLKLTKIRGVTFLDLTKLMRSTPTIMSRKEGTLNLLAPDSESVGN